MKNRRRSRCVASAVILLALTCYAIARDESYVPDGFIPQSVNRMDDRIAIVSCKVAKWNGIGKPIDVTIVEVLHGPNALLKVTQISDDEFDPVFSKNFKPASRWILRIKPRTVDGQKQWVISYYETSHLNLIDDTVSGQIVKHSKEEKMKYRDFKAVLAKEIEKRKAKKSSVTALPH